MFRSILIKKINFVYKTVICIKLTIVTTYCGRLVILESFYIFYVDKFILM